ncbi:hypothetical protein FB567DRAFT_533436 [Paraphoma chrysanthemicola]|uniref:Uncharacterized protein n=1 Tax=Paraphoma chrysanthemicola TaxID=798071 RepID=A0A8K0VVE6_9PLEO|nr:hypothetical protein FB567DRAFT_533436 [Paraphoma chrysanthemicola]
MSGSDDFVMAKHMSLVTETDRCFASSSEAPQAPLLNLLSRMEDVREQLVKLDKKEKEVDAGAMARLVDKWADHLQMIILRLDVAEQARSKDVFKSIDWYNKNLADAEKGMRSAFVRELKRKEQKWQGAMEQQKQIYEAKQMAADQQRMIAQRSDTPALDRSLPTTMGNQHEPYAQTNHGNATQPISQQYHTEIAFLKSKIDRLADQNALLRKSQSESTSMKAVMNREISIRDHKIKQIKEMYEVHVNHHKTKIEALADTNAELRKQLKLCVTQDKRKAEDTLEGSEEAVGSPKKVKD